jgi:hypothetical protein
MINEAMRRREDGIRMGKHGSIEAMRGLELMRDDTGTRSNETSTGGR